MIFDGAGPFVERALIANLFVPKQPLKGQWKMSPFENESKERHSPLQTLLKTKS
jgi:hypothetical protein